jgi:hypothetical protein
MRKIVKLNRDQLVEYIQKSIKKNILEQDYSSDIDRPTSDREVEVKGIFGPKYSRYIPNDVIRYMRKNPSLIFERLYKMYGEDAFEYLNKAKEKSSRSSSEPMMEQFDDEEEMGSDDFLDRLREVIENDEELIDSDINEIFDYSGPKRSFRGSIYLDGVVPETEDKEFDRKVAMKVMEFFANKTEADQYVGGVGFKRRDISNPFDKEF